MRLFGMNYGVWTECKDLATYPGISDGVALTLLVTCVK